MKTLSMFVIVLATIGCGLTMELQEESYLGDDFKRSSKNMWSKNVWIYNGDLSEDGLNKVEDILNKNEKRLNESDGYVVIPDDKKLSFKEEMELIEWALDKEEKVDINTSVLHRFIWMSLSMLKDAVNSLSSGSFYQWIEAHREFYFGE